MAMLKPSQSYSGGVIVDPYTGNIAQEMQFLSGEDRKKKTKPILRLGCHGQPSNKLYFNVLIMSTFFMARTNFDMNSEESEFYYSKEILKRKEKITMKKKYRFAT